MSMPTDVGQSAQLLTEVVHVLDKAKLPYCVIGALAGAVHGVVRASLDADLTVFLPKADFTPEKLHKLLEQSGFKALLRKGDLFDPISALLQVSDSFENRVDILIGVRGIPIDCLNRTIEKSLFGTSLRFIGLEDFILSKVAAGGPLDINDVEEVLAVSGKSVNHALIEELAKILEPEQQQLLKKLLTDV